MATRTRLNTLLLTQYAILSTIIVILAFTPLGYLKFGVVEITFIIIPVAVGAIKLGVGAGAFLGAVFGITSFIQCFGLSPFGAMLLSINPVYTFILCMIPRVAAGAIAALIFKALHKIDKTKLVSFAVGSLSVAAVNTIFFMVGLMLMFGRTDFILGIRGDVPLLPFVVGFVGLNGVIEALACTIIAGSVCKALYGYMR